MLYFYMALFDLFIYLTYILTHLFTNIKYGNLYHAMSRELTDNDSIKTFKSKYFLLYYSLDTTKLLRRNISINLSK